MLTTKVQRDLPSISSFSPPISVTTYQIQHSCFNKLEEVASRKEPCYLVILPLENGVTNCLLCYVQLNGFTWIPHIFHTLLTDRIYMMLSQEDHGCIESNPQHLVLQECRYECTLNTGFVSAELWQRVSYSRTLLDIRQISSCKSSPRQSLHCLSSQKSNAESRCRNASQQPIMRTAAACC